MIELKQININSLESVLFTFENHIFSEKPITENNIVFIGLTLVGQKIKFLDDIFEITNFNVFTKRFFCVKDTNDQYANINFDFYVFIEKTIQGEIVFVALEPIFKVRRLKKYNRILRRASERRKAYLKHCFDNAIAPRRWIPPSRLTKKEILDGEIIFRPIF